MGRVSRAVADQHHQELVEAAARLFRERDMGSVSVPDVMQEIGLTRGGFYKHFDSKDALVAAAVEQAFAEHVERVHRFAVEQGEDPDSTRQVFIDFCLSFSHRDNPGDGCPSALASGVSRSDVDSAPRVAFVDGLRTLLEVLAERTGTSEHDTAEHWDRVLGDFAILVGALLLSRATAGDSLSEEILAAVRGRLA